MQSNDLLCGDLQWLGRSTCRYEKKLLERWVYFSSLIFHTAALRSETLSNLRSRRVSVVQINERMTVQIAVEALSYILRQVWFAAPRATITDAI
jgi:hypothetical protein